MNIRLIVTLVSIATLTALVQPAFACDEEEVADAWRARSKNVELIGRGEAWADVDAVRHRTKWLHRIQLLADDPGDELTWNFGYVEACNTEDDGTKHCLQGNRMTIAEAFRLFAKVNGSTHAQVRAARRSRAGVYTIQMAASRNESVADRLAEVDVFAEDGAAVYADLAYDPMDDDETPGRITWAAASAPYPHVQSRPAQDGTSVHQVIVGVFFDRSEAASDLVAAREAYPDAFVRPL